MKMAILAVALLVCAVCAAPAEAAGTDKTLVAWVSPANLTQRGGSALTIQVGDRFDAIVLGERSPGRWMAGSNFFRRTPDPGVQERSTASAPAATAVSEIGAASWGRWMRTGSSARLFSSSISSTVPVLSAHTPMI